jgi:hypothetical protein
MDSKACKYCHEEKPLSEFQKRKKNKDGLDARCKTCRSKKSRTIESRNRDGNRRQWANGTYRWLNLGPRDY